MVKNNVLKIIILVYCKIYSDMIGMRQSPHLARFSALAQTALLLSLNTLAFVLLVFTFTNIGESEASFWGKDFWLLLKVAMLLSVLTFFFLIKKVTAQFDRHCAQIRNAKDSKSFQRVAIIYPYFVFGLLISSIVAFTVFKK